MLRQTANAATGSKVSWRGGGRVRERAKLIQKATVNEQLGQMATQNVANRFGALVIGDSFECLMQGRSVKGESPKTTESF
jgi:hypothetical protein